MKKYIVTIFSLLICILIAQDAKTYLAQADLEDKIQSKVTTALSKMFDDDKFFVWARVELNKKQSSMDSESGEQEEKTMESNKDPFGYDVFEGLGLTGLSTLPSVPNVIMPGESSPAIESSYSFGDYDLKRIAVSIYISESIYDINARKTITNFINDEFPQIRDCFDCFKLETMPDKGNSSNESNLEIAFKELRLNQPLFYEVNQFLESNNFILIDFLNFNKWERDIYRNFGEIMVVDALYLRRPEYILENIDLSNEENYANLIRYVIILAMYKRLDLLKYMKRNLKNDYKICNCIESIVEILDKRFKILYYLQDSFVDRLFRFILNDSKSSLLY